VPGKKGLTLDGLQISPEALHELFRVDPDDWEIDLADSREFFAKFGDRFPEELREQHRRAAARIESAARPNRQPARATPSRIF